METRHRRQGQYPRSLAYRRATRSPAQPVPIPLFALVTNRLRSVPLPPTLLRFIPGTSRSFGPPRRTRPLTQLISRHGGELRAAPVQRHQSRPPWTPLDDHSGPLEGGFVSELPPAFVFALPDTRLLGPDGWIVGPDDTFVTESSFWTYSTTKPLLADHPIYARKKTSGLRYLTGTTLSLASEFSVGSFGHLISDSLVRLHLFFQAGYTLADIDQIYFPHVLGANTAAIVAHLGLPSRRVLNWTPGVDLHCERLIATTFPGLPGNPPPDSVAFIQDLLATPGPPPTARIYLCRQNAPRKIVNHDAIAAILRAHDFETCPPESTPDLVARCAAAHCVVSADGSNFNNIVFCPRGTSLLLIRAPALASPPYSFTLAAGCGHRLHAITARSAPDDQLHVDPAVFSAALQIALRA